MRNENLALTVDTGFTDYIALHKRILEKLNLQYKAIETYILANGESVEAKIYKGEAIVKGKILKTLFIQGDY